MNKIMPYVAGVFFALFGFGVIALLFTYTFSALGYVFPDNLFAQIMGMVLFDIAALAWLAALIYLCKSVMQYAFSFIGFVFGLGGSLLMVVMEVMLGGQELMEAPAWVNEALIYGFILAAVVHVVLYYAFKLSAPEISADISLGFETAQITDEAMKQAEAQLLQQRGALGGVIAPRLISNVRRNLGLPVSGDYIDASAYDVPEDGSIPAYMPQYQTASQATKAKAGLFTRLKLAGQALIDPGAMQPQYTPAHARQAPINQPGQSPTAPIEPTPINQPGQAPTAPIEPQAEPIKHEAPLYHPDLKISGDAPAQGDPQPEPINKPQESEDAKVPPFPLPKSGNGGSQPSQG